jgi:hypothetical protein
VVTGATIRVGTTRSGVVVSLAVGSTVRHLRGGRVYESKGQRKWLGSKIWVKVRVRSMKSIFWSDPSIRVSVTNDR